jgi:hypothetical protein
MATPGHLDAVDAGSALTVNSIPRLSARNSPTFSKTANGRRTGHVGLAILGAADAGNE